MNPKNNGKTNKTEEINFDKITEENVMVMANSLNYVLENTQEYIHRNILSNKLKRAYLFGYGKALNELKTKKSKDILEKIKKLILYNEQEYVLLLKSGIKFSSKAKKIGDIK
jgi:hypothetical protein